MAFRVKEFPDRVFDSIQELALYKKWRLRILEKIKNKKNITEIKIKGLIKKRDIESLINDNKDKQ